jgi:hypothetical protein
VSSRWDDPSWWPKPRRRDKPPPSATKLFVGTLLPIFAIAGLVIALTGFKHSEKPTGRAAVTHQTTTGPVDPREAFRECMQSAGAGSRRGGSRFGGRFGGGARGPSEKYMQAFAVCRSLLQTGSAPPPPASTGPATPPVA